MSDLSGPELNKAWVKNGLDLWAIFTDGSTEYGAYNYIVQKSYCSKQYSQRR